MYIFLISKSQYINIERYILTFPTATVVLFIFHCIIIFCYFVYCCYFFMLEYFCHIFFITLLPKLVIIPHKLFNLDEKPYSHLKYTIIILLFILFAAFDLNFCSNINSKFIILLFPFIQYFFAHCFLFNHFCHYIFMRVSCIKDFLYNLNFFFFCYKNLAH